MRALVAFLLLIGETNDEKNNPNSYFLSVADSNRICLPSTDNRRRRHNYRSQIRYTALDRIDPDGTPLYAPHPLSIAVPAMAMEQLALFAVIEGM